MQFWKMNGVGNDFIILNNIQEGLPAEFAQGVPARAEKKRQTTHVFAPYLLSVT